GEGDQRSGPQARGGGHRPRRQLRDQGSGGPAPRDRGRVRSPGQAPHPAHQGPEGPGRPRGSRGAAASRPLLPQPDADDGVAGGEARGLPFPAFVPAGSPAAVRRARAARARRGDPAHRRAAGPRAPARRTRRRRLMPSEAPNRDRQALERLIVHIAAAINVRALYSGAHPRVGQAVQSILDDLTAALAGRESVTLFIVGEDLIADDRPLRRSGIYQQNFVQALRRRRVERLTLVRGLDAPECLQFVSGMASGATPGSTANVIVGGVEFAVADGVGNAAVEAKESAPISAEQIAAGQEAFARFRTDRQGSLQKMEEVVWSLMETLARSAHDVIPLAPLKSHDEY